MIWEVRMPRLDDAMKEGTILRWIKHEGEPVQKGEPIVEIETQKVNYEIEAPGTGILRLIVEREEELVPINAIIGVIAESDEDISAYRDMVKEKRKEDEPEARGVSASPAPGTPAAAPEEKKRILITPIARKLAGERGLDISRIRGTGPGGRITKEDVLHFRPSERAFPEEEPKHGIRRTLPFSGMRKTIADRMLESWRSAPRAEHFMSADVTELVRIRDNNKEAWERKHGVRPSVNDVVLAAAAKALRAFPMVNASLRDGRIEVDEDINISVAVALERGLITPVLRRADARDIFAVARETRRLAELVRKGEHSPEILADSTFTITNLGMFDVEFFVPIINPPESAILAVGKIEKKPVVINDAIAIRSMMRLCLAYDHRLLDGVVAARFLQSIKHELENPASLMPEGA
ncbi:MAG: 2-oxo acid dehydrogenase subunit E2 [Deltaproteobacteria bacterium]|nr:2-oxo acid dehydrogenase subunit E2 [Deltaproteobacteria bacterium]MBW2307600.1 2-oxo acid dehydrogenase subunit E2 [Deltaproteobacteria bacterium]